MEDNFDNIDCSMSPGKKPLDSSLDYPYVSKNQNHEHNGLVPTNGLAMNEDNVINLGGELTELTPFEEAEGLAPAEDDSEKKNVVMSFINNSIGYIVMTIVCAAAFFFLCVMCTNTIVVIAFGVVGSFIGTGYAYANDFKYPNLMVLYVFGTVLISNVCFFAFNYVVFGEISIYALYSDSEREYIFSVISWFQ
jgi:hypothetical protein